MNWYVVAAGLLVSGCLFYTAVLVWGAKHSVEAAPKTEMFICEVHGALPLGSTMALFDSDMEYEENGRIKRGAIRVCPICFQDKIKTAKERYGK